MLNRVSLLLCLFCFSHYANAANAGVGHAEGYWYYLQKKNIAAIVERVTTTVPTNPSGRELAIPSAQTISNNPGGGVTILNSANVPVGGKSVPVSTARVAGNAALAAAAGGVLKNAVRIGVPAVGALMTLVAVKDMFDAAGVLFDPKTSTASQPLYKNVLSDGTRPSDGFDWSGGSGCVSPDPVAAAMCRFVQIGGDAADVTGSSVTTNSPTSKTVVLTRKNGATNSIGVARQASSCPAGWFILSSGQCVPDANEKKLLTPDEITALIAQHQIRADALQALINEDLEHQRKNGIDPFGYQSPSLQTSTPQTSGPSSSPGSSSTSSKETTVSPGTTTPTSPSSPGAQPATQTTTTNTTNNYTYNNNVVNNITTTTTTTTITNNVTNETSPPVTETEETDKPDPEEEDPPVDSPLGDLPKLYDRKYPEGLVGIWNQKSQQIKQASLFTLAADLMPTGLTSGTCPAWPINLDFESWASYGVRDVAPPCWIWDVAKTIVIISALMLARSLIFGG